MVHQWGFFGSISAIRKIWSLTANSRSSQAAALKSLSEHKQANKMFCVSFVLRMKMKSHSILHSLVTDVLCHDF